MDVVARDGIEKQADLYESVSFHRSGFGQEKRMHKYMSSTRFKKERKNTKRNWKRINRIENNIGEAKSNYKTGRNDNKEAQQGGKSRKVAIVF